MQIGNPPENPVSIVVELESDRSPQDNEIKIPNESFDKWHRLRSLCRSWHARAVAKRIHKDSNAHDEHDGNVEPNEENENQYTYAANKNIAEGLMDIALLSANANQLRFLITYNQRATFYHICLTLVILSLILQLAVGIALILRRRWPITATLDDHDTYIYHRNPPQWTNTFVIGGVFLVTAVNVMLAALTTTDDQQQQQQKP